MAERITDMAVLAPLLAQGWVLAADGLSITREFRFAGFARAFGFMASVAVVAERLNHHPDWSNSYGRVKIQLSTHSAGGLTTLDLALAGEINALAA
ncbi:MAG: 4a-hydroxytetrahydrobiopterin dehydratase [Rhodobacteraceae bacterium]|nr:4a-hydroxytetrahydrobiopterin dehydratase [Paracoccaceae bacterium]